MTAVERFLVITYVQLCITVELRVEECSKEGVEGKVGMTVADLTAGDDSGVGVDEDPGELDAGVQMLKAGGQDGLARCVGVVNISPGLNQ